MNSLPYYTPNESLTFLGFEMQQNRFAPLAWSEVIQREKPERIIEIGTWKGGFTCVLGLAMRSIRGILSYDNDEGRPWQHNSHWMAVLGAEQRRIDVFCDDGMWEIEKALAVRKTILLCDGGNKIREFQTFAPFLKSGDMIAAHDYTDTRSLQFWNTQEIVPLDVEKTVQECGLERYEPQLMAEAGWLAYKKV